MDGIMCEVQNKEQLLEYLQANGVTVIIWDREGLHTGKTYNVSEEQTQLPLREKIARELVRMGFRQGQVGFNNIVEAIGLIAQLGRGVQIRVTSDIYPKVAERQGSSVCSVERTIRNAIESVWKRSNLHTLQEMYPYPCDNLNGRPTNAEFLINMAGNFRE